MVIARLIKASLRQLPAVNSKASAASAILGQIGCSAQRISSRPIAQRQTYHATATDVARQATSPARVGICVTANATLKSTAFSRRHQLARELYRPTCRSLKRLKTFITPRAQAGSADFEYPEDSQHHNSSNKAGVLSALQGIKAENTLVIAVFLKALLLGSSGSIVAARLAQSGYGHTVGVLQGLSLVPAAIGIFLLTRYILERQLHLRKGFAWGIFLAGVLLLALSNRYSAMQRKYSAVPAPPVAQAAPRVNREQYSRHRALPTANDSDEAFQAHLGTNAEQEWEWRSKNE